ncbi:MAG TPA: response regulator [Planctomycetota bacterium]|nr:response regulator [Planctomycetota bacterium]
MNILLVDDERDVRTLIHDLLVPAGHSVTMASSVLEAIVHVELRRFDLVLLDLMMPGIDGFQFAEFMSSHWNTFETPVLILSCRKDPESRSLARIYNCVGYLEKPFGPAELLDAVHAAQERFHPAPGTPVRPARSTDR